MGAFLCCLIQYCINLHTLREEMSLSIITEWGWGVFGTQLMFTVRNMDGKSTSSSNGHKKLRLLMSLNAPAWLIWECLLCKIVTGLGSFSVFTQELCKDLSLLLKLQCKQWFLWLCTLVWLRGKARTILRNLVYTRKAGISFLLWVRQILWPLLSPQETDNSRQCCTAST